MKKQPKRSKKPIQIIVLVFLLNILLISFLQLNLGTNLTEDRNQQAENPVDLHTSAGEITLNSPNNTTYTEPMSGYYPGTYGFESDEIGTDPAGWTVDEVGGTVGIIDSIQDHNKVIEVHDTSGAYEPEARNMFSPQTSGTVEFWMMASDVSERTYFRLMDDQATSIYSPGIGRVAFENNMLRYWDDAGQHDTAISVNPNTWYHFKIEFECSSGNYQGLSSQSWRFYVNGQQFGDFNFEDSINNVSNAYFFTHWDDYLTSYLDAVGYSWDPNYEIGDNLNEGLLLSYDTSTSLDWQAYSLDGQTNVTISGNTTIPMPADGTHTIQVFGNNTSGEIFESEVQQFTIDTSADGSISIVSPEDTTYTEPMSGYYPGTYGFESDEIGTDPAGWTVDEVGGTVGIIDSIQDHNKVIEVHDTSGAYEPEARNMFSPQTSGTVEFWMMASDVSERTYFRLMDDQATSIYSPGIGRVAFENNMLRYWDDAGQHDTAISVNPNTWYHFKIEFECSSGNYQGLSSQSWRFYVNGQQFGDFNFEDSINNVSNAYFFTHWDDYLTSYLDAVGYSWDPNYEIGDNLNEGLLLSYDTSTSLDWQAYSLDGQTNVTISGNTTIPMPADGTHTIQVFGNNTSGEIFESEVQQFTIDTSADGSISIVSPEDTTYTEPMSGYYPGTYGFENDKIGDEPQDLEVRYYLDRIMPCEVISEINGHKNVVYMDDTRNDAHIALKDNFTKPQSSGTIELWARVGSTADRFETIISDTNGDRIMSVRFDANGDFRYELGVDNWYKITDYSANTWYHIKLVFDSSTDKYSVWLNDNLEAENLDYTVGTADAERITIRTQGYDYADAWVDALSYSWDPNYEIGDNLNEGLLLSYDNTTNLDWQAYSLDGQTNVTISGNSTIPMPADGTHTIQVFGNNTSGEIFESELHQFIIDTGTDGSISIVSPEDTTYTEPMSGYYPGTYGFENDENGAQPIRWVDNGDGGTMQVVASQDGHKNVVHLDDTNYGNYIGMVNDFESPQNSGTLEWWIWTNDVVETNTFRFYDSDSQIILAKIDSNSIWYYSTTSIYDDHDLNYEIFPNTWYHIKMEFDCGSKVYNLSINGDKVGTSLPFVDDSATDMTGLKFHTDGSDIMNSYIDAIGYSWDPNYEIGDNLNEGLLLSYENTTNLDWQGYSLDGQANVTIFGNTTIPILEDGDHTIQVFGNDTSGNIIESELRHFTINCDDLTAPTISTNDSLIYLKQGEACWIGWNVSDPANGNYIIYENGTAISSDSFTSSAELTTFVYSETVVSMNYTLIAEDSYGNKRQANVLVSIYSSEYDYLASSGINIVSREGLYLEIETNGPAFLQVSQSSESEHFVDIQGGIWANLTALQFYSFELLDTNYEEDSSLLENATIRFYYTQISDNVKDPSDLYVLHGVYDGQYIKIWDRVDLSLHEEMDYVEITIDSFSYYCLAELEVKEGPGNDDETDAGPDLLIFITDNLILIIILASVGVAVPTLYTVRSKQQKKKKSAETLKSKEKLSKDTIKHDLKRKAETKRRQLERTWEPEDLTEQTDHPNSRKATQSETKSLHTRIRPVGPKKKVKKSKATTHQPLSEKEREQIKEERKQTENELGIETEKEICQVHKGPIRGFSYICPKCQTKYCIKCANALAKQDEGCWVCETKIKIDFPDVNRNSNDALQKLPRENGKSLKEYTDSEDLLALLKNQDYWSLRKKFEHISLTPISDEFWEKLEKLRLNDIDIQELLSDLLSLTPKERLRIIDGMLKLKDENDD